MKKLLFLLVFSFGFFKSQSLSELRTYLQKGETSEEVSKNLINKSKYAYETTNKPIYEAFYAVGNFFMAKYAGNPISKYSYFKKGKKLLEDAVKKEPNNVEIRLMRYISQEKTPKLLGYNENMKTDKEFIMKNYKNCGDDNLINFIKKYFKI